MTTPNNPAVYLRCSSKSQDLDAQRQAIDRYLKGRNIAVGLEHWYEEPSTSGKDMDRPALKELHNAIFNGEVNCVCFYSVDRFARTLVEGLAELDRWQKAGVRMIFVSQGMEINPAEWSGQIIMKLLISVTLAFAEMERERILTRQRCGIDSAITKTQVVKELLEDGSKSPETIAVLVGVQPSHVRYIMAHPDCMVYWGGRKEGAKPVKKAKADKIVALLERGFNATEVAHQLKCGRATVYRRLKEIGGAPAVRGKIKE